MISQVPTATISAGSATLCTNRTVLFSSATTNTPTTFAWAVTPSVNIAIGAPADQPTVAISFGKTGNYTVSLVVSNISGTTTATQIVSVKQTPTALFSASLTNNGYPNQITGTNFSSNATNYLWTFNPGAVTYTTTDVSNSYTASGSYTMELIASNSNGCSDTSRYNFYINDSSGISLPNIFTPNDDGINDIFKPIARGMSSMKVWVYNRYGVLMYSWETINGFWDGHTTSGEACMNGVYFYMVEATGFDGKNYSLKSHLTLLRN